MVERDERLNRSLHAYWYVVLTDATTDYFGTVKTYQVDEIPKSIINIRMKTLIIRNALICRLRKLLQCGKL